PSNRADANARATLSGAGRGVNEDALDARRLAARSFVAASAICNVRLTATAALPLRRSTGVRRSPNATPRLILVVSSRILVAADNSTLESPDCRTRAREDEIRRRRRSHGATS